MDDQRVGKMYWEWRPEKRRPKRRWKDEMEDVLEKYGFPYIPR